MKTVILTGGLGSGKSAVSAYLRSHGVPVYDSDSRTKRLYDRDPVLVDRLEEALSVPLRDEKGVFCRSALAGVFFADSSKKALVESIVHPAVLSDFLRWKSWQRPKGWTYGPVPFVALESAIILSCPVFEGIGDKVVLVEAPEEVRVERAVLRDGSTPEAILRRIRRQSFDRTLADAVLCNDGTLEALHEAVDRVFLNLFAIFV